MPNLQEQYERGYLDIPGMGQKSLAELDAMSPEVRKIVADALRALYG